jgi:hypothetical protein
MTAIVALPSVLRRQPADRVAQATPANLRRQLRIPTGGPRTAAGSRS